MEATQAPEAATIPRYGLSTEAGKRCLMRHQRRYGAQVPAPYDVHNFLNLLGIEIAAEGEQTTARLTVHHDLIAGTGYLWAPVVIAIADALCAFGVSRHWPENAASFTTVEAKANFLSSAGEGDVVVGEASPLHLGSATQVWDATVRNQTTGKKMAAYRCTQLILYPRP